MELLANNMHEGVFVGTENISSFNLLFIRLHQILGWHHLEGALDIQCKYVDHYFVND